MGSKKTAKRLRHKIIHQHLSRDDHPNIAFVAVRTITVMQHTLLYLLLDAEERKELARSADSEVEAAREAT